MHRENMYLFVFLALFALVASCKSEESESRRDFIPSEPIVINQFYPDSGGIATPILIEGKNFGKDTVGLKVYFKDKDEIKHPAGLVSTNGNLIYAYVPKGLTFKREMAIIVEKTTKDGSVYEGTAEYPFLYKTQTAVSTVAGLADPDSKTNTVGGDFATCTFSSPYNLCLDNEDNIILVERPSQRQGGNFQPNTYPRDQNGKSVSGNISLLTQQNSSTIVLKYGTSYINAPIFDNTPDNETVYVPDDSGMKYWELKQALTYVPRYKAVLKSEELSSVDEGNWKHCFVVNKNDHFLYTVMWKGQLVQINPRTRTAKILLKKVSEISSNMHGGNGSDAYISFSPVPGQENILYVCLCDCNQIWTVDLDKITEDNKETYHGEPYAGKAIHEGAQTGKGWEDGLLLNAKFCYPRQICFTSDGKLYIADSGNHCIRSIDTTIPKEKATVITPIGLPGAKGYKDGGPDIAKFAFPCGVAVSADGSIVYVADTQNKVIRKLSVQ